MECPVPGPGGRHPGARASRQRPERGYGAARSRQKLSFLFMGCNRIQHSDWKLIKKDDPSSANLPQFQRTSQDIAKLQPTPPYLFFTGDLVVNLKDDKGEELKKQLDAWTELYNASPMAGKLTLIPMPGNHEMLQKLVDDKDDEDKIEVPNPYVDPAMGRVAPQEPFRHVRQGGQRPARGPSEVGPPRRRPERAHLFLRHRGRPFHRDQTDTLTTIVNPETKYPYIGWFPYHWIEQDVRAAQASSRISAIFLFGHKPLSTPKGGQEGTIINTKEYPLADKLRALLLANDKVRAYLCADEHQWDHSPLDKARESGK